MPTRPDAPRHVTCWSPRSLASPRSLRSLGSRLARLPRTQALAWALPRAIARAATLAAALALGSPAAHAVDTSPAPPADRLAAARGEIKAQRWPQALAELRRVNDSGSADWHNLMGFTLRKSSPPDLDAAERHYDQALRLQPTHRGALEYSGELYLVRGDLPRAEQRLAALEAACGGRCEEYKDLQQSIARHRAAR